MNVLNHYLESNEASDLSLEDVAKLCIAAFAFFTVVALVSNWAFITRQTPFFGTLIKQGDKVKLKRKRVIPDKGEDKNQEWRILNEAIVENVTPALFKVKVQSIKNDKEISWREISQKSLYETHELVHPNLKRLSWVIGLVNASITSFIGIRYVLDVISNQPDFFEMELNPSDLFTGQTNLSVSICSIFFVGNFSDLFYGFIFYRDFVDPLTGWFHHCMYMALMIYVCTSLPYFSKLILLCFVEEVPTFFLALGSIFPSCRVDLPYGLLFIILRVAFHVFIFMYSFPINDKVISTCFVLTLAMHTFWAMGWVNSYFGDKKKDKKV